MTLSRVLTVAVAAALGAGTAGAARADSAPPIDLLWAVKVPLRDGVRLNATLFKPAGQDKPLPVVFTLTPYNSDTYYPRARYFAQNGYVFALVDVRGRHLVPIHWGTFDLTEEPMEEPPARLLAEARRLGLGSERVWLMKHGETRRW